MSVVTDTLHKPQTRKILYNIHIIYALYGVHFQVLMRVSSFSVVVFLSTHRHRHRPHLFPIGIDV